MKETRLLMGMPITVEIADPAATSLMINKVFDYFKYIDETFSVYKPESEISKINKGLLTENNYSIDMKEVLALCEKTKTETRGYFDIVKNGRLDPSGLVKGWAIWQAAKLLEKLGFENYYVDAGGDIQVHGRNSQREKWTVGIRNPFNREENVKILEIEDEGVATSGTYIRGQHIYDPFSPGKPLVEVVSLTVIGPNIYEADRFATAAFAMGREGIDFIENLKGFEGYAVETNRRATYTSGFEKYQKKK